MSVLNNSTILISKGEVTHARMPGIKAQLWGLLLSETDPAANQFERVDFHFIQVGVNAKRAEVDRREFTRLLDTYPYPAKLSSGPSYKHVGSVLGDDLAALRLFALGKTLGLWKIRMPMDFGVDTDLLDYAVDLGFIVCDGYRPATRSGLLRAVG